ncbi:MAG: hypothetical protein QM796_02460 [Chthoniobacteraceae bacterium]
MSKMFVSSTSQYYMPDFQSLLAQALSTGSRSTTVRPLGWLVGLTLTATILAVECKADSWIKILVAVLAAVSVVAYLAAYVYFAITDKDCLRSEKYSIQKLAIQNGLVGDDTTGFMRIQNPIVVNAPEIKNGAEQDA